MKTFNERYAPVFEKLANYITAKHPRNSQGEKFSLCSFKDNSELIKEVGQGTIKLLYQYLIGGLGFFVLTVVMIPQITM